MDTIQLQRGSLVSRRCFDTCSVEVAVPMHVGSRGLKTSPVLPLKLHDDKGQIATWKFMPGSLCGMCPLSPHVSLELKSKHCLFYEDSEIKTKQTIGI